MTVRVGTGTSGTRFLNTEWPITEGLTLGTTKLPDDQILEAEDANVSYGTSDIGL